MKEDSKHLFSPKANLGIIVRGPMRGLTSFWDGFEALCREHDLRIAFKVASASKLWITGEQDRNEGFNQEPTA